MLMTAATFGKSGRRQGQRFYALRADAVRKQQHWEVAVIRASVSMPFGLTPFGNNRTSAMASRRTFLLVSMPFGLTPFGNPFTILLSLTCDDDARCAGSRATPPELW
ncbi:hypothetical protein ACFUVP_29725 [Streptomyces olivaceus]|uniref:hypothetical protein n=1 Tax=Streptomyces olivaceus TaxID=47716 RepID=UPI0036402CE8